MRKLDWRFGLACALLVLSAGSVQAADTVYKWVDESGTTHYGTRPPNGVESTAITPKTGHSEPVNYKHTSANADDASQPQSAGNDGEAESKKDPERCAAARKNADILSRGGRVRESTDDGSFRFLEEEEKQKRLEAAQKAIAEAC
ncbi:DUF4124 domain-containing protein [Gilvimarinus sp. SDUM040013]|uniref:DUF4124 domain-containing protein n=1 Tax=Gilvimarinus gilvus TaxID=3058038 RepID=A0ABU4S5U4_9GAMM|nr:DUF4124 domain-containing protein [Gilvimarinus sp. SDUM040013]MDO3384871.1 DUF4124 domain-containing protein [Gilvimarinus sp. SDUM040013]MDX6850704.1 DUF4124 domain-containing protein [Gilvimarinus sp. SDUM040013]